jgi:hypothetical protein
MLSNIFLIWWNKRNHAAHKHQPQKVTPFTDLRWIFCFFCLSRRKSDLISARSSVLEVGESKGKRASKVCFDYVTRRLN